MPTPYYDFTPAGDMIEVCEKTRRQSKGLKYLTQDRVREYSDGRFDKAGWLVSDSVSLPSHYSGSDNLNGVHGLMNPVDGKYYDSKAAYNRAVKEAGCVILGDDASKVFEKAQPKLQKIDWKVAVAETIKQLPPTPKKRKKT
jgi:hypothetical protein